MKFNTIMRHFERITQDKKLIAAMLGGMVVGLVLRTIFLKGLMLISTVLIALAASAVSGYAIFKVLDAFSQSKSKK